MGKKGKTGKNFCSNPLDICCSHSQACDRCSVYSRTNEHSFETRAWHTLSIIATPRSETNACENVYFYNTSRFRGLTCGKKHYFEFFFRSIPKRNVLENIKLSEIFRFCFYRFTKTAVTFFLFGTKTPAMTNSLHFLILFKSLIQSVRLLSFFYRSVNFEKKKQTGNKIFCGK